jgi:hypothetical protein
MFIIKCPSCEFESKLVSPLFEEQHVSQQYLRMIVSDSKNDKKEKLTNYIPEQQRKNIFDHVSSCKKCSERIDDLRLSEISKEIKFNEKTYVFFVAKAKDIIKELDPSKNQVELNCIGVKSFLFEDEHYHVCEEDLFYHHHGELNGVMIERFCYNLEKEEFSIGMVSFVMSNGKIILEKIWLKSQQRIEKEKQFLSNLRSGKIRILFDLIQKLHNFV